VRVVGPGELAEVRAWQLLQHESLRDPEVRFENDALRFASIEVPIPDGLPQDPVVRALDFLDSRVQPVFAACADHHFRAPLTCSPRNRAADAARGACDDHHLLMQRLLSHGAFIPRR